MPRSRVEEGEEEDETLVYEEEEETQPFAEEEDEEEAVGGAWEPFMLVSLPLEEEGWEERVEHVALRSTVHAKISGTTDYKTSNKWY